METTRIYSNLGFFRFDVPVSIEVTDISVNFCYKNGDKTMLLTMNRGDILCVCHYEKPYEFVEYYDNIWIMDVETLLTKNYKNLSDMRMDIKR